MIVDFRSIVFRFKQYLEKKTINALLQFYFEWLEEEPCMWSFKIILKDEKNYNFKFLKSKER